MITSYIRSSISRAYSMCGPSLIVLVCLPLLSAVYAALPPPPPGGGYPDGNTAVGTGALLDLTTGRGQHCSRFPSAHRKHPKVASTLPLVLLPLGAIASATEIRRLVLGRFPQSRPEA